MAFAKEKTASLLIALISFVCTFFVMSVEPLAQDLSYHLFSDQREVLGIPNFWNVISNLPFLFVGIVGLHNIFHSSTIILLSSSKSAYVLFFIGVTGVAFGSGFYHLWPGNASLVWDRLPMTVAFMALFSIIISEFMSSKWGKFLLWPLISFGALSVFYWHLTESSGRGDLRPYLLVQFLPMLLMPLILWLYKSSFTNIMGYWLLLAAYVLAKALEYFDGAIYNNFALLSGHSLKHLIAALGIYMLLKTYNNRAQSN